MAKHPRKRQKTVKGDNAGPKKTARLEMLLDEESKDDEERRLESLLFGVKYVPRARGKGKMKDTSDEEYEQAEDAEEESGRGLQHLLDQDLFFVDGGTIPVLRDSEDSSDSEPGGSFSEKESISQASSSSQPSQGKAPQKSLPKSLASSRPKPPAWTDPADTKPTHISLLSGPTRLRKLRQVVDEDEISGRDYETRLRAQFERINPEPAWARRARKNGKGSASDDEANEVNQEEDGEGIANLLSSTTGILGAEKKRGRNNVVLPQGTLAIERVRDANQSVQGTGSADVRVLTFHPKPSVPVLCVATADRRIRLFNIDGHLSPLLSTLHVPSLPLLSSSSVLFHPQGSAMLISGPRPFFYTYDLQQGTSTLHRRGLWGTGFDDSFILDMNNGANSKRRRRGNDGPGGGKGSSGNTETILHTAFSPSTGSLLAVAGRGGNVHIVDWKTGAGQVIGSLKCATSGGGGGGGVQGLWWVPSSGVDDALGSNSGSENDEKHLAVLTGEAEVYIWDVAQRRCVRRWKDEGGYRGAGRVFAGGGGVKGFMAIGSTSGFVNVYGSDSFLAPDGERAFSMSPTGNPTLLKALGHLTTPISTLRFNHDAQLLAMASKDKKDSMRLVHLPSLTAFGNWPTSSTPLGHVTTVDFSPRSEYIAIGNTRGKVLLYHLKDYGTRGGYALNSL